MSKLKLNRRLFTRRPSNPARQRPIFEAIESRRLLTADVAGLWLINADTDQPIMQLSDGMTLNLNELPTDHLNVRADANSETESVRFDIDGSKYRVENTAPYALAGDRDGNYHDWTPSLGSLVLSATPYNSDGARGEAGDTTTLHLNIVREDKPDTPLPPAAPTSLSGRAADGQIELSWSDNSDNESGFRIEQKINGAWSVIATLPTGATSHSLDATAAGTYEFRAVAFNDAGASGYSNIAVVQVSSAPRVSGFVLVDAGSDTDALALTDGATIAEGSLPSGVNFRADVAGEGIDRVEFTLSGAMAATRSEGTAPYALFGDRDGDYHAMSLPSGSYTLSAVPILADGSRGEALTISFTIGEGGSGDGGDTGGDTGGGDTNTAPVARSDSASVLSGGVLKLDVLGNDTDADGDALSVANTTSPRNGRITVGADNTIAYTPNSGFAGTDSFTYQVSDGTALSGWATVTITVTSDDGGGDTNRPNDATTGHSGQLTNWTGSNKITTPGVYENYRFNGNVRIETSNVTLRNCEIVGTGSPGTAALVIISELQNVMVEHSTIRGGYASLVTVKSGTVQYCHLYDAAQDAFDLGGDGVKLLYNFVEHPLGYGEGAHADGIQIASGTNFQIIGNNIYMPKGVSGTRSNACIIIKDSSNDIANGLVQGNWFSGGNYTLMVHDGGHGGPENIRIIDNYFARPPAVKYGVLSGDVEEWTNNRWEDGELIPEP